MSHPIHKIIRTEALDYITINGERKFKFDLDKREFVVSKGNLLLKYIDRILPKNIVFYVVNLKEIAKGNLDIVWENELNHRLKLRIQYALKIPSENQQSVILALQDGISMPDAFAGRVRDFIDEFYERTHDSGFDPVLDYFKVSKQGGSIKEELILFLSDEIESKIGFKVRSLRILELVDDKEQQKLLEIKRIGDLEAMDIKLKGFRETLKANYEIKLGIAESANKIYAFTRQNETHRFPTISERCIQECLLRQISLEQATTDKRRVNEALKKELNKQFRTYGREVVFFDFSIIGIERFTLTPIPLISCTIKSSVKDFKGDLIFNNKIALSITNHALYKESKLGNPADWIEKQLKNIIEKDVITFNDYRTILIDNISGKKFQLQLREKLSARVSNYGLNIINFESKILNTFRLPAEDEPIHQEVKCDVKGSDELIHFGNTISITLIDRSKFIQNIPLLDYSKSGNYFNDWLKSELDIIVKRIIEFKDYRTIVIESAENYSNHNNHDEIYIDNEANYKAQIKHAIEKKAREIGCEVNQLLIEPNLPPLSWLEESIVVFDDEFNTERDGIPIKFKTTISYRIRALDKLASELIKPNLDMNRKVQNVVNDVISRKLLTTSSERAYLEFYEGNINGEISVDEELKVLINEELSRKFCAYISFVNFKPLSTPFLENYKLLRNIDGKFYFEIYNSGIKIPIEGNFEVTGVSNWNRYKAKIEDAPIMIERIESAIKSSLKKRLERTNINDIMMNDFVTQRNLEAGVNRIVKEEISNRFGLFIRIFDFNRGRTLIDEKATENAKIGIEDQAKIDLETNKFLLSENQEKLRSLFKEKKELEKKVKFNLAKEEEVEQLKKINKKIRKISQTKNLNSLTSSNAQLKSGNSINEIFGTNPDDQKSLE